MAAQLLPLPRAIVTSCGQKGKQKNAKGSKNEEKTAKTL